MKRAQLLALILVLIALVGFRSFTHKSVPRVSRAVMGTVIGCSNIPVANGVLNGVSLPCLDNKSKVSYQAIRGPVVENVFGSWCAPCNEEIPHFLDLQALHKVAI